MERSRLPALTVAEVVERWPQTVAVFLHHRMACVGCAMAPFETVSEVSAIYGLPLAQFVEELQHAIGLREEEP